MLFRSLILGTQLFRNLILQTKCYSAVRYIEHNVIQKFNITNKLLFISFNKIFFLRDSKMLRKALYRSEFSEKLKNIYIARRQEGGIYIYMKDKKNRFYFIYITLHTIDQLKRRIFKTFLAEGF